jgi:hypothetical protein
VKLESENFHTEKSILSQHYGFTNALIEKPELQDVAIEVDAEWLDRELKAMQAVRVNEKEMVERMIMGKITFPPCKCETHRRCGGEDVCGCDCNFCYSEKYLAIGG